MRRFLLLLTLFSVPGWSQAPAQQVAQPPIVVKVEMPPAPRRPKHFTTYKVWNKFLSLLLRSRTSLTSNQ